MLSSKSAPDKRAGLTFYNTAVVNPTIHFRVLCMCQIKICIYFLKLESANEHRLMALKSVTHKQHNSE
jgi:hypothetical protein